MQLIDNLCVFDEMRSCPYIRELKVTYINQCHRHYPYSHHDYCPSNHHRFNNEMSSAEHAACILMEPLHKISDSALNMRRAASSCFLPFAFCDFTAAKVEF